MRKLLRYSTFILLIQALLVSGVYSSERVDYLIEEDSARELDSIQEKLYQLDQLKFQLQKVELHLAKKKSGENVYLKFERIVGAVVLSAVVAGSASIYFPPGARAMIAANISAKGLASGMVVLNENDANRILNDLFLFKMKIETSKNVLLKTSDYYCKFVPHHDICH